MNIPSNLFYTESDEWLRLEADGTLTLGITDYAQSQLGELVFVEVSEVGSRVTLSNTCGVVESVKAVGEVYSPIEGEVVTSNSGLAETPELVNQEPYEGGWMVCIRPDTAVDTSKLMNAEAYVSYHAD